MIKSLLEKVDSKRMAHDLFYLSKNPLPFRKLNYTLPGHAKNTLYEANDFIAEQLTLAGCQIRMEPVMVQAYRRDVNKKPLSSHYSPPKPEDIWYTAYNVYGVRRGKSRPEEIIVVLAHNDSQSWIDSPGAADNAIGTAGVLELARAVSGHEFERTIWFLFCSEEHPPMTSLAAANMARVRGDKITAVFNLDAIGGKPADQAKAGQKTNVTVFSTPEGERLGRLLDEMNERYRIGLEQRMQSVGAAISDEGSFVKAGYPAAVCNIGSWPYGDPNYHAEQDVPELVDIANAAMVVQAILAAVVTLDES